MLAQVARQNIHKPLELVEWDEVPAVVEVDVLTVAPVGFEGGQPGFDVRARHHRMRREQKQRAGDFRNDLWLLKQRPTHDGDVAQEGICLEIARIAFWLTGR
jgi:hypothetical protein